ncbi:uncharacterized protein KY384_004450 [Bacidia gigantensis]|uniref:uncharacterized protein n=1 Tax=Bacidia gigantensis TaxID=2732470 RepID=UPI001D04BCAC|nr:uncharacterized protein KY384_004450 [Bacidia gigantensis]KAG8531093.1 hypothetical protein KY384_004450 [Bacidia gigantensis]
MTVNRHKDQTGHSLLTIYWATPQDSSSLDMKNKNESEILQKLINVTNAIPRETDAEEAAEVDEVAEDKKRRDAHRQRQLGFNERRKRELAMLEKARGSTG